MKAESIKQNIEAENHDLKQLSNEFSALSFRLKIGFDGKRAANNNTGLGNYSRSLLAHLAQYYPNNKYYIYTPKISERFRQLPLFSEPNVNIIFPQKKENSSLWRSFGIVKQLKADQIDLFHGLSHEIPFGLHKSKIKSVVTMHDLIFLVYPKYYKFIDRLIYRFKSKYACEKADRIIAISHQTKNDIVRYLDIDPSKIDVIYQSCDDQFKVIYETEEKEKVRTKYKLPARYLLNVGTIEERKNLLQVIRALPHTDSDVPLVVIGKETPYAKLVKQEIKALGLTERVTFLSNVPFSDLPHIYQMASVFVYPSKYEGFGIPIIEALYGKIPVVAATGSCLEEAGGLDSIYVSPNDPMELANAVNKIINNSDLSLKMSEKGLTYAQKFNEEIVTEQLMQCYLNLLGK